jgi:hypothetical protein
LHEAAQDWLEGKEFFVVGIFKPTEDVDAVFWLHLVIVGNVIYYYRFGQIPAQQ